MIEENINQKFRFKNIDETAIYIVQEIKQNQLMSERYKKVCGVLNIIHLLIFIFCSYWVCFHFCFCFFVLYFVGITSSAIEL